MNTLPILLGNLLKEIAPTYHIVLQDESWALLCHQRKILTHLLIGLLPGQMGLSNLSCSSLTTMMCGFTGTVVAWWLHSSSVSDFIQELQPFPLSLAIKSCFIQFPKSRFLLSNGGFHDNLCLWWCRLQNCISSLLCDTELVSLTSLILLHSHIILDFDSNITKCNVHVDEVSFQINWRESESKL